MPPGSPSVIPILRRVIGSFSWPLPLPSYPPFFRFVALFFSFPAVPDFGQVRSDEPSIHRNSPPVGLMKDLRLFNILSFFRTDFKTVSNPPPVGELDEIVAAGAPEEPLDIPFPV